MYSIAGGETVSTFLAATTYYLCKTPIAYQKLQNEIRGRYQSYQDIDAASALQLPYLQAVIQEGLRIFPPGSQGFPRTSPGVMIDNHWIPAGVSIITLPFPVKQSLCHGRLTNRLCDRPRYTLVHGR